MRCASPSKSPTGPGHRRHGLTAHRTRSGPLRAPRGRAVLPLPLPPGSRASVDASQRHGAGFAPAPDASPESRRLDARTALEFPALRPAPPPPASARIGGQLSARIGAATGRLLRIRHTRPPGANSGAGLPFRGGRGPIRARRRLPQPGHHAGHGCGRGKCGQAASALVRTCGSRERRVAVEHGPDLAARRKASMPVSASFTRHHARSGTPRPRSARRAVAPATAPPQGRIPRLLSRNPGFYPLPRYHHLFYRVS